MTTYKDVLAGKAAWSCERADALEWLRGLPDDSADLVFFSPPYEDCRLYEQGFRLKGQAWVDWLAPIIRESARVSAGLVVVNMAAKVEDFRYSAAVEWLVADLTRVHGLACGPSPYVWVKSENHEEADGNGQPGSGGQHYHRRDFEPIYAFADPEKLPPRWSDNTAFGHPPKYGAGGPPSHRRTDGTRVNGARFRHTKRIKGRGHDGGDSMEVQHYVPPAISNAGNVIRVPVGGGKLGHPLAHDGEASMALGVAERFVCWYVPPDGVVADPFTGSGTTAHTAFIHGRRFVGCDNRLSQVELTGRRMRTVTPPLFAGVTE